MSLNDSCFYVFFFQAEDGIRDYKVTGVQTCALPICEYANATVREVLKPILELLSAVPTVVFGYFALLFITPMLQSFIPNLPGFNMLEIGRASCRERE